MFQGGFANAVAAAGDNQKLFHKGAAVMLTIKQRLYKTRIGVRQTYFLGLAAKGLFT
jgi:hypothetical protein